MAALLRKKSKNLVVTNNRQSDKLSLNLNRVLVKFCGRRLKRFFIKD